MSYQVLSRKYRPQDFDEVVGQDHVSRILQNALASDRVGHAYLFVGPRGVGKTTMARILARALNCARRAEGGAPEPCGECPSCRDVAAGVDLDVVEMDAASNNHVEDVRRLREQVGYATVRSPHRIWIVDEVHMLSMPAFNAFLKTLEEPPEGVIFVFCTTEEHKLPDTFRSRCQRIEFRPIDETAMAERLARLAAEEGVEVEEGLCRDIAAGALGGLRDAESLLDQLIAACPDGTLRREDLDALAGRASGARLEALLGAVDEGDAGGALDALDACLASGARPGVLLEQWLEALRGRLVDRARARGEGDGGGVAPVARAMDVLLEKRAHLRAGADGVLVCQVAAVELARLPDARDLDALMQALARGGAGGSAPPSASPGARPAASEAPASGAGQARGGRQAPGEGKAGREAGGGSASSPRASAGSAQGSRASTGSAGGAQAAAAVATAPPRPARSAGEAWPDLLAAAQERDGRLAEVLRRVAPGDEEDGCLVLEVDASDALARSALARRQSVLAFRELCEHVLGRPLAPRLALREASEPSAGDAGRAVDPDEHPSIRRVRELTDGRLLDIERRDAPGDGS